MGSTEKFHVDIMATHPEVTGSSILCVVRYPDKTSEKFVVDFGLFQEEDYDALNTEMIFKQENIDFATITHNHVDHLGRIPMLAAEGFKGKIYTSRDTSKLMELALEDSYKVLKDIAKRKNKKELYSLRNVSDVMQFVSPCEMEQTINATKNIKLTMFTNGHLVGAAILLFQISYPEKEDINILFTGDYNSKNIFFDVPELPNWVKKLNLTVITESTYGTTTTSEVEEVFEENLLEAVKQEKSVLCMAFSLGRFQEIMYKLKCMQEEGFLDKDIDIYGDGKLARRYTNLYLDGELTIRNDRINFLPSNAEYVDKVSRKQIIEEANSIQKIIVTTSGMGHYGPANYYIPETISKENWMLHFTGYGVYGRMLMQYEKGEVVKVSGLQKVKRAEVCCTSEFSSHAKADELLDFLRQFENLKFVIVNHGQTDVKASFSQKIVEEIQNIKDVAILDRDYYYRINSYGWSKTMTSKFK